MTLCCHGNREGALICRDSPDHFAPCLLDWREPSWKLGVVLLKEANG